MEYEKFKKILKEYNFTLKKFSELAEVPYQTCTKWGKDNRAVPSWVNSWFKLYEKSLGLKDEEYQELLQLKELITSIAQKNIKAS